MQLVFINEVLGHLKRVRVKAHVQCTGKSSGMTFLVRRVGWRDHNPHIVSVAQLVKGVILN